MSLCTGLLDFRPHQFFDYFFYGGIKSLMYCTSFDNAKDLVESESAAVRVAEAVVIPQADGARVRRDLSPITYPSSPPRSGAPILPVVLPPRTDNRAVILESRAIAFRLAKNEEARASGWLPERADSLFFLSSFHY
ncbi:hypothetical protein NPIL_440421 [Nephila pilipes]|uniref:Uncharacterized protein n=1 Tax=Nephila pilipes TaxID=299642 RepID=A0A8X6TGR2_NEPPI|nr:hypothetical protein NPIL_440421 [Nephila pilipes]